MWLKLSNGREELVQNEDHIKRLKDEGAIEIDGPSTEAEKKQSESPEKPKSALTPSEVLHQLNAPKSVDDTGKSDKSKK